MKTTGSFISPTYLSQSTVTFILAGGKGERLYPLTRDRSKPSVPFGGSFRIIDFSLSNSVNSGFRKIYILTQFLSQSLYFHLKEGWNIFHHATGDFIHMVPAQQQMGALWYQGTADAIYQNVNRLEDHKPQYTMVLSGDHVYKMNYQELFNFHIEHKADMTVSVHSIPRDQTRHFGVLVADKEQRITHFVEKPEDPSQIPGDPNGDALINMGIYLFNTDFLVKTLAQDARNSSSAHDFGKNIIPSIIKSKRVYAYRFSDNSLGKYWQDVGTIDGYFDTSMRLLDSTPAFNLYGDNWPIRTFLETLPSATINNHSKTARINQSIISHGCYIEDAVLDHAILSPGVVVKKDAVIENSIILNHTTIGEGAVIKNAIIDKDVEVPPGTKLGVNLKTDAKLFMVANDRIVVVPKRYIFT